MNRQYWKLQRKGKDIKLREIAKEINIDISTISRYENNKRDMTSEQIRAYQNFIENKKI